MTSQALYNRWRSQTFDDVLGQEHITGTLKNQIRGGRIGHAYLFTGLRGTGKTSMARIMAKAVNCVGDTDNPPCNVCHMCTTITEGRSLDLMEIDAASNRGIDEIRELRERVGFVPHEARFKVYVIDEVHMLTKEASNALLKTLEEPPSHVIFIMCTTEPHRLLDTILSRCQRFDFRRASVPVILTKLRQICDGENLTVDPEALEYIARRAVGSFRDAESLLEHIAAHASGGIDLDLVQHLLGSVPTELVTDLISAMVTGDARSGLRLVNEALDQGADPRQFIGEILDQLRGLLLLSVGSEDGLAQLGPGTVDALRRLTAMPSFSAPFLLGAIRSFNDAAQGLRTAVRTQLPLELALIETITGANTTGVSQVASPDTRGDAARPARNSDSSDKRRSAQVSESSASAAVVSPAVTSPAESAPAQKNPARPPRSPEDSPPLDGKHAAAPSDVLPAEAAAIVPPSSLRPAPVAEQGPVPKADGRGAGVTDAEAPRGSGVLAGASTITLEWAQGKWSQIISRMGAIDRSLQAFLRSAYPVRVTEDVLVLGCESQFHRDRLSEPKRALVVEQVISEVLEAPCRIQCVLEKGATARPRGDSAPDEHLFSGVDRDAQRKQELLNHPAVKALEQRGGQVTQVDLTEDDSEQGREDSNGEQR